MLGFQLQLNMLSAGYHFNFISYLKLERLSNIIIAEEYTYITWFLNVYRNLHAMNAIEDGVKYTVSPSYSPAPSFKTKTQHAQTWP